MGGRGMGRGRGRNMSFSVETLGFGRGEALPGPILQPPPMFPPSEFKPVPLLAGDEYDYLLALKQEYRAAMKESPYYIKPPEKKRDIERYSDKYQISGHDSSNSWEPDWSRLPMELRSNVRKKRKIRTDLKPKIPLSNKHADDIKKTLEELEKKESNEGGEAREDDEENEDEEQDIEEEFYEDEDLEDENDYNLNYFDNGEEFGLDDDDGLDEGPTY